MAKPHEVRVHRVYDDRDAADGSKVLVDRIGLRASTKGRGQLAEWRKSVAPSTVLCKGRDHDPKCFGEFTHRRRPEPAEPEAVVSRTQLAALADRRTLMLLIATTHPEISVAAVLADGVRL